MTVIRRAAIVLNGFVHDFASGYWFACLAVIVLLERTASQLTGMEAPLNGVQRFFFWNSVGAVAAILATGGGRAFTYVDNVFGAETEKTRRRLLLLKHAVLLPLFAAGSWYGWSFAYR